MAIRIERPEEVKAGIEKAINTPGPVVVDIVVEREEMCLPVMPTGVGTVDVVQVGETARDTSFPGWR